MSKSIEGIVTWLKNWFYDSDDIDGFVTTLTNSINSKLNSNLTEANKNLVTNGSGYVVLEDKPVIPDVSGFIDTAGTGLSKSGTTLNHTDSVSAQTTAVARKIKYNATGHITGTSALYGSDIAVSSSDSTKINTALSNKANSVHIHSINDITSLQSELDDLDGRIDDLESIKAIEVVSSLPTASADTMNRLYIVSENSKINVYYTVTDGQTFEWHKMDADILDELSIAWNDITGKPSTFTPSSHTHGNITNDGKVGSNADYFVITGTGGAVTSQKRIGKISTDGKLYTDTSAGVTLNNAVLMTSSTGSIIGGSSLNANKVTDVNAHTNIGTDGSTHQETINTAIDTAIGNLQGGIITSIVLVDKATDSSGKIIFYTGDEPS